ncbi:hypothetical protein B0H16DRAFT_1349865 [Mycena metata]|uniref:Uncharacterized protein n=1 Tax=Mycena metata TaxID=1033252 RepID=A0AAD7GJQ0_9AGAR|nr:hypothetical protein B0H16DRAFT_1349865 [Mycena metata]
MAAFHHHPPTAFNVDADTHTAAAGSATTPTSLRRVRDPNIDPQLYTPSKRMRMMTSALASTSSGSFLVGPAQVTSVSRIPAPVLEGPPSLAPPNWDHLAVPDDAVEGLTWKELIEYAKGMKNDLRNSQQQIRARDGIIESAHATIVVQNLHVEKQSQALHAKETKKKTKREKLPMAGRGHHLTAQELIDAAERAKRQREEEEAAKAKRAGEREVAKEAKEKLQKEWEKIKEDHEKAVDAWKEECDQLLADGVLKRNLPKKPARARKPTAPKRPTTQDDSDGSDDENDDENTND